MSRPSNRAKRRQRGSLRYIFTATPTPVMDGKTTMRLRAAMATAALMGLGGALAPTYAEDTAAAVALPGAVALQTSLPTDPALPRFAPQADDNTLTATPAPDSAPADSRVWEPVGGGVAS